MRKYIDLLSKLDPQYVWPIFSLSSDYSTPTITLQRCNTGDARRYLRGKPTADRMRVCLEVAQALRYLHSLERPIIHAVLKGSSIFISDEGRALLTDLELSDFEKARWPKNFDVDSEWIRWMAPELLSSSILTKSCDIWAWGMTALELMTSQPPFRMIVNHQRVREAILNGEVPQLDSQSSALDVELWALMEKCWHKDPDQRPDIKEVAENMSSIYALHS